MKDKEDKLDKQIERLQEQISEITYKKLTTEEYKKIEEFMQITRNLKWELDAERKRIESSRERADKYYNKYNEEVKENEKLRNSYKEVCNKYAKLEIENDIANAKIKILKEK